jgi:hypothetical protein
MAFTDARTAYGAAAVVSDRRSADRDPRGDILLAAHEDRAAALMGRHHGRSGPLLFIAQLVGMAINVYLIMTA